MCVVRARADSYLARLILAGHASPAEQIESRLKPQACGAKALVERAIVRL